MHNRAYLIALLCAAPINAWGNSCLEALQPRITQWNHNANAIYAPQASNKAMALYGAAMIAHERAMDEDVTIACRQANEALDLAENTAEYFQHSYPELFKLRQSRQQLDIYTNELPPQDRDTLAQMDQQAEKLLPKLVYALESGQLNEAPAMVQQLKKIYQVAIGLTIPVITNKAGQYLASARGANADAFAPQTYNQAKQALITLEKYNFGQTHILPEYPDQALILAQRAMEIGQKVRGWRREPGSHEMLWLNNLDLRFDLANRLGIASNAHGIKNDTPNDDLIAAVEQLKTEIVTLKNDHAHAIEALNASHRQELADQLETQQQQLQTLKNQQITELKEALKHKFDREIESVNIQAKTQFDEAQAKALAEKAQVEATAKALEEKYQRDTFEQRRQNKLKGLFTEDEVEIFINLDSSILIRLKALAFAPGRTKIEDNQAPFFKRLADGLNIYSNRNVQIEGHTDSDGEIRDNQQLSLKRAEAVQKYLIQMGVEATRLKALGYGEVKPIASNEFEKGKAMNRRIDIIIEKYQ
ncbi:MAG: OmpA family protein [Zetaproteobacteria bacterium]|nr:OmpA family protein [Zetaproteobacteria bacterium]